MMTKKNFTEKLSEAVSFEMIYVEGGIFMMGGQDDEVRNNEKPVHKVTLPGLYVGQYQVTQLLWKAVMGVEKSPSKFQGDDLPVERVSWNDTQVFLEKLNSLTGKSYRLLSESEWEYAARGGQKSQGYKYAGSNKLKEVGWYYENSYGATKPVGLKNPNELGIYDMSGNVWEWVEDHWHDSYNAAPNNGKAWLSLNINATRVARGGSRGSGERDCQVTFRNSRGPNQGKSIHFGFRLGLSD